MSDAEEIRELVEKSTRRMTIAVEDLIVIAELAPTSLYDALSMWMSNLVSGIADLRRRIGIEDDAALRTAFAQLKKVILRIQGRM